MPQQTTIDLSFLDDHEIICWDIDGTLVQNAFAAAFHEYIRAHPEKKHVLVTFRDPEWAALVYEEIAPSLDHTHFNGLYACPPAVFEAANRLNFWDVTAEDRAAFVEWKGKTVSEIGGTILVDDMVHHVRPGCERYNVSLVHAMQPFGYHFERRS